VNRVLGVLTRNAPLKLGAVALASVLYGGLVFSQNVRVWPGPVPIEPIGQGSQVFLLGVEPQSVTSVRFVAPGSVASSVNAQSFRASVDLTGLTPTPDGSPIAVPVRVVALDPQIQVTGWTPTTALVRLDTIRTKTVPVRVDRGTVPAGLAAGEPVVDPVAVNVRGPGSVVDRVDAAVARVIVDASGVDVDEDVDLVAVDARGDRVTPVDFEPSSVHVRIAVTVAGTTRTVPVVPKLRGSPAVGFALTGLRVQPVDVVIAGPRATLQGISEVDTEPVSIAGAHADVTADTKLVLPQGVTVEGSSTVTVTATITPLTGSTTFTVGIVLTGTSSQFTYAVSAGSTLAVVSGPVTALGALSGSSLQATADVSGLGVGTHTLPLRVTVPSGLRVTSLVPAQVTVTISAVSSPTPTPTATP
jgi:YbbR domain-containing protein